MRHREDNKNVIDNELQGRVLGYTYSSVLKQVKTFEESVIESLTT